MVKLSNAELHFGGRRQGFQTVKTKDIAAIKAAATN